MLILLITAASVAAFEIAAVKYGSDSRVDTPDGAAGTPMHSSSNRWI